MHAAPLGRVGAVVGGGPNEWMTEVEPVRLEDHPLPGRPWTLHREHEVADSWPNCPPCHRSQAAGGRGARRAVKARRGRWSSGSDSPAPRYQQRVGCQQTGNSTSASGFRERHRGFSPAPPANLRSFSASTRAVFTVERADRQDVQTGQRRCAGSLSGNKDGGDARETPSRERARRASRIDPLQIVDDDQRWAVLGSCREQPDVATPTANRSTTSAD